jgi:hypothetical protein
MFQDIRIGKTPKVQAMKTKIDKCDSIKVKTCIGKETFNRGQKQPTK